MSIIGDMIAENRREEILDAVEKGKKYVRENFCDKIDKMYIDGFIDGLEFLKKELLGEDDV